ENAEPCAEGCCAESIQVAQHGSGTRSRLGAAVALYRMRGEQAGLKQVAVAGIKVGMLEGIADDPSPSRPWLFRVEEGPYRKYFEWLDALRFPTIERFMEVFMRTYETDLRPANDRPTRNFSSRF